MNKLVEKFIAIIHDNKLDSGIKTEKKCAEECEIICLKFTEWMRDHSWEEQYRDQVTYTDKQLFNIFINNHLK